MALLNEAGDSLQTKPQEKKVLKQKKEENKNNLESLHQHIQKMMIDDKAFSTLY